MEHLFKVGQQVKVIEHEENDYTWSGADTAGKSGQTGTITEIDRYDDDQPYSVLFEDGDYVWFPEAVLDPAEPKKWEPKFKVGDKIDYWPTGYEVEAWRGSEVIKVGSTAPGYEESYQVDHPEMGVGTMRENEMRPHTPTPEPEPDAVEHPTHYSAGMPEGIEVRDIIKAQGFWKEFCMGNVVKYSLRWQYKNGIEDLRKLRQYTDWLIEELEADDV